MPRASNRGGRNARAGRKPGAAYQPVSPSRSLAETGEVAHVQASDVQILVMADMHVRNFSNRAIARQLGCAAETVTKYLEARPDLVDEARRQFLAARDPRAALEPLRGPAVQVYAEALDQREDLALAARVAGDVYDRLDGKPVIQQRIDKRERIEVVFIDE